MTDDIVTRLREDNWCWCKGQKRSECPEPIMLKAADEIERLRHELALALARTCRCVNTGATNE